MAKTIGSIDLASLKNLRDDVTQYFWFESNSSSAWGSGAHVTLYPESQFTNPNHANYMKGQNIIMNTDGFSIRNGVLPMMVLDNDSLDFNAIDTTQGTYTTMATFGLTGATIGQSGAAHSVIDANGQRFYASDGTTQLANIGYDKGANASGGTSVAPYYTFGMRKTTTAVYDPTTYYEIGDLCLYDDGNGYKTYACVQDITTSEPWNASHWVYYIGNYSCAEGNSTTASGYASHTEGSDTTASRFASHAEGYLTEASNLYSHAEGYDTTASGYASHAEGYDTTASRFASHAEGCYTTASGYASHAGGRYTTAQRKSQTAIGENNIADTGGTDETTRGDYAFIIGNGTSSVPSNALTVDWDGFVVATSAKKNIMYTGEYIMLYGNKSDVSKSEGQVGLSTTAQNCLPADKYSIFKSPLADDLYSVSSGEVTILKAGRYRLSGQIYLYNGFTVNDVVYCSILSDGTGANSRASRCKAFSTTPYATLTADTITNPASGTKYTLASNNGTAARGTVGLNGYTRLMIECLGIYES